VFHSAVTANHFCQLPINLTLLSTASSSPPPPNSAAWTTKWADGIEHRISLASQNWMRNKIRSASKTATENNSPPLKRKETNWRRTIPWWKSKSSKNGKARLWNIRITKNTTMQVKFQKKLLRISAPPSIISSSVEPLRRMNYREKSMYTTVILMPQTTTNNAKNTSKVQICNKWKTRNQ